MTTNQLVSIQLPNSEMPLQSGGTIRLSSGEVSGLLRVTAVTDAPPSTAPGCIAVEFDFADGSGELFRYRTVLLPDLLFPSHHNNVRRCPLSFEPDLELRAVHDTREAFSIPLLDEPPLEGHLKYLDVVYRLKVQPRSLQVHASFEAAGPFEAVYDVPLSYLMWRKAPSLRPSELIPENEPGIDVERLEPHSPRAPSQPCIEVSLSTSEAPRTEASFHDVAVELSREVTLHGDGDALRLSPGTITGGLQIGHCDEPKHHLTAIRFALNDANGRGHEYSLIVDARWFWPPPSSVVRVVSAPSNRTPLEDTPLAWRKAFGSETINDDVDYSIKTSDGDMPIEGTRRGTSYMWRASISQDVLQVWARFTTVSPRAVGSAIQIEYELSLGHILGLDRPPDGRDGLVDVGLAQMETGAQAKNASVQVVRSGQSQST